MKNPSRLKRRDRKEINRLQQAAQDRPAVDMPKSDGATLSSREFSAEQVNQTERPQSLESMREAGKQSRAQAAKKTPRRASAPPASVVKPPAGPGPGITRPTDKGRTIHMNGPGGRVEARDAADAARKDRTSSQQVNPYNRSNQDGKIRGVAPVGFVSPATEGSKAADTQRNLAIATNTALMMGAESAFVGGIGIGTMIQAGRAARAVRTVNKADDVLTGTVGRTGSRQIGRGSREVPGEFSVVRPPSPPPRAGSVGTNQVPPSRQLTKPNPFSVQTSAPKPPTQFTPSGLPRPNARLQTPAANTGSKPNPFGTRSTEPTRRSAAGATVVKPRGLPKPNAKKPTTKKATTKKK